MQWCDVLAFAVAVLAVLWFVSMVARGDPRRHEEDEARMFFDRHGRWPDEA